MDDEDSRSSMYPHDTGSSDSSEPADPDQTIRRGRGRGRGRGRDTLRGVRGRGRGPRRASRGRGQPRRGAADGPNRAQVAAATLEERNRQLQDRISRLSDCDLRGLVVDIASQHPEFVFDVLDRDDGQHGGHHPPPDGPTPAWCTCTYCREMPTEAERRCCGRTRPNCYSRLPDFYLIVLDEAVLAVARRLREELLVMPPDEDLNRANRFAAYRQFIVWQHGRLGAGIRRVIPSCCVWRIRDKYPNPFGQYKGFVGGRFN